MSAPPTKGATPAGAGAPARRSSFSIGVRLAGALVITALFVFATVKACDQPLREDPLAAIETLGLDWWQSPIERNPHRRLPLIPDGIEDIHVTADGTRAWLVGSGGLIAALHKPENGDYELTSRDSGVPHILRDVFFVDERKGWCVGDRMTLLATDDGGETWQPRALPLSEVESSRPEKPHLMGIHFADSDVGVAVGIGVIFHTFDGGQSWQNGTLKAEAPPPEAADVKAAVWAEPPPRAVKLESLENGWGQAAGAPPASAEPDKEDDPAQGPPPQPSPMATAEGETEQGSEEGSGGSAGKRPGGGRKPPPRPRTPTRDPDEQAVETPPEPIDPPPVARTIPPLRDVYLVSATKGWAVGVSGIMTTEDGGATWTEALSSMELNLNTVHFADEEHGIAVGARGTILETTDGETWKESKSGVEQDIWGALVESKNQAWAVGDGGAVMSRARADGGWTGSSADNEPHDLRAVSIAQVGDDEGVQHKLWIAGHGGRVVVPPGVEWSAPRTRAFGAARFFDTDRAWLVGRGGSVLSTQDSGETWQSLERPGERDLVAVYQGPEQVTRVVDETGKTAEWDGATGGWKDAAPWTESLTAIRGFDDTTGFGWALDANGRLLIAETPATPWNPVEAALHVSREPGWVAFKEGSSAPEPREKLHFQAVDFRNKVDGLAIDLDGRLLRTEDRGQTWTKTGSIIGDRIGWLEAVDNLRAWAAGSNGRLHEIEGDTVKVVQLRLDDHEEPDKATATQEALIHVRFFEGGNGAVVGAGGTVWRTADGGASWEPLTEPFRAWPAPWYFAVCALLTILLLIPAVQPRKTQVVEYDAVEDALVSDRPLEHSDPDPLNFKPLALSLSRFIRNENTQPPLVFGVTGKWGSGKSSLMNLAASDLRTRGYAPVWFNAWHHQKEEHLLASLLENVRLQAGPPPWSRAGLMFRLRLLARRSSLAWLVCCLLLAGVTAGYAFSDNQDPTVSLPSALGQLDPKSWDGWFDLVKSCLAVLGQANPVFSCLASLLLVVLGLSKAMRKFGVSPWQLLVTTSGRTRGAALQAQTGFRKRFADEFRAVTNALKPHKLVIVIDDLDRCRPRNVLEVLEAVNFLAVSGDCIVLMGMDSEMVRKCVGLGFKEVAQEMIDDHEIEAAADAEGVEKEELKRQQEKAKRQEFAKQYLEKLVNIEVPVPTPKNTQLIDVLVPSTEQQSEPSMLASALDWLSAYAPPALAALAIVAAVATGFWFERYVETEYEAEVGTQDVFGPAAPEIDATATPAPEAAAGPATVESTAAPDAEQPATGDQSAALSPGEPGPETNAERAEQPPAPRRLPPASGGGVAPADEIARPSVPALVGLGILLLLVVLIFIPRVETVVKDSPDFKQALRIWRPLLTRRNPSPRRMKRFLNRVRFYAMRQRPMSEETGWQQVRDSLFRKGEPLTDSDHWSIPEPVLVALAAIEHYDPSWIDDPGRWALIESGDIMNLDGETLKDTGTGKDERWAAGVDLIRTALSEHQQQFGGLPDAEILKLSRETIAQMTEQVRLS